MRKLTLFAALCFCACSSSSSSSSTSGGSSTTTTTSSGSTASSASSTSTTASSATSASASSSGSTGASASSSGSTGSAGSTGDASSGGSTTGAPQPATITRFTATPNDLPAAGGDVTLAWTVDGAQTLTLQPGVGDVTGLDGYTVHVGATTTFRLIASNAAGTVVATADVTVEALPTVTGRVVDACNLPAPGVLVYVVGHPAVQTDALGTFTVADVVFPYTAVISTPEIGILLITENIVTATPTLEVVSEGACGAGSGDALGYFDIHGTLQNLPGDTDQVAVTLVLADGGNINNVTSNGAAYSVSGNVPTDHDTFGTLFALTSGTTDDGGLPVINGFGSQSVDLYDGMPDTVDDGGYDVTLGEVGTRYLSVTFDGGVPDGGVRSLTANLGVGGHASLSLPTTVLDDGTGLVALPAVDAGPVAVAAALSIVTSSQACNSESLFDVAPTTSQVGASFPAFPLVSSPFPYATSVNRSTQFSWASLGTGFGYLAILNCEGESLAVATTSAQFTLPDLQAIGYDLPHDSDCQLQVVGIGGVSASEQVLGAFANLELGGNGTGNVAVCQTEFSTAP